MELHFLPYLRRGLVRHLGVADPGDGGLSAASLAVHFDVGGLPVDRTVNLLAAHHVAVVAPSEIVRRWPTDGADDVEPNYLALVEFAAPDLPWRYTPGGPGTDGRLRPWLALVVVEEGDGVSYSTATTSVGELTVDPEQLHQLPPDDELWAWAHVQSSLPVEQVEAAAVDTPDVLRSRLICPRWLQPGRRYRVAVVSAFRAGDGERSEPAWRAGQSEAAVLTVHDTWTFTTAAKAGDFEALCERLEAASDAGRLGVRHVDITDSGLDIDWPAKRVGIELVGALADPDLVDPPPPPPTATFAEVVVPMLDEVLARTPDSMMINRPYDPLDDDPVVGLPFYGAWPSGATEVPPGGWAREVNVRPDRRIAAGLGAKLVRRHQESLMAAAWDQLGEVRAVSDEVNRKRLAAEIGRTWQARVAQVDEGDRINLAAPLLSYVRVGQQAARRVLRRSRVPTAIADRAWIRRVPRARGAAAATTFVRATEPNTPGALTSAFAFSAVAVPPGTNGIDPVMLSADDSDTLLSTTARAHLEQHDLASSIGGELLDRYVRDGGLVGRAVDRPVVRRTVATAQRVVATAADVAVEVAQLDPLQAVRASLVERIAGLEALLPAGELPADLALAPHFSDPLLLDLAAMDADVIVPGLDGFPNNRVRLLGVNGGFVGALLIGANHAMAEELRWREYPADLAATFFDRFFAYHDPDAADIAGILGWKPGTGVAANVTSAESTTAILVRGDVIRRYPDVNIFLARAGRDGQPDDTAVVQPVFETRLASDTRVVGFPLAPSVVLGRPPYFVIFEERVVAPRFGLDVDREGRLTTWDELAQTDFHDASRESAPDHVPAKAVPGRGALVLDDIQWGRNSAHLAAAVHQRPYRHAFRATDLVLP